MSTVEQYSKPPEPNEMVRMKATVRDHVQRDLQSGGLWSCKCNDCEQIRSLIGVEKMLEVRPLVREVERIEEHLARLQEGAERLELTKRYLALHDRLADAMAK
jgi:hypothetical protein